MEEKGLAEVVHLAKEDEEEAVTELLRRFDPLIMSIHHHYFFHEMDQDDFAQEARIMMLRAVRKYDENHAVSFAGYYQRCLKNLAVECLRREHRQRLIPHELVVRGEKAELALLSASVDSCERQVLLHEEAEEYFHHLSRFERDVFLGGWTVRPLRRWRTISINQSRPSRELTSGARRNSKTILEKDDDKSR